MTEEEQRITEDVRKCSSTAIKVFWNCYIDEKYPLKSVTGESINHPQWYNTGKIEVIDFIEDQQLNFHLGNAVKYICRAGKKNSDGTSVSLSAISNLKKAMWYLQRHIKQLEKTNES